MGIRNTLTLAEKEQIALLHANGDTPSAIGKKLGRDHKTVGKALSAPDMRGRVEELQEELSARYMETAFRLIESITDSDISKINAYQRTIAGCALVDKIRLMTGMSTSNTAIVISRTVRQYAEDDY